MTKLARALWLSVLIACIVYACWMYDKLPQRIAMGWKASGEPKDWTNKDVFFSVLAVFCALENLVFYILSGSALKKIPDSILSLPWKSYWFATPARKEQGYQKLQLVMVYTGILMNAILLLFLHMVLQGNTGATSVSFSTWTAILAILIAVLGFLALILFTLKPPAGLPRD